jgi:hypothetical protein
VRTENKEVLTDKNKKDMNVGRFFIDNLRGNKGIQCRFGMRGIISEAHYDTGRNMNAQIRGYKRIILLPPSACKNLSIITDPDDPSYRHSTIDWSSLKDAEKHGFANVPAMETIMQPGEMLYIPSYWLHYIISLRYNIQCNSRSGFPVNHQGQAEIEQCLGFQLEIPKHEKATCKSDGGSSNSNSVGGDGSESQCNNAAAASDKGGNAGVGGTTRMDEDGVDICSASRVISGENDGGETCTSARSSKTRNGKVTDQTPIDNSGGTFNDDIELDYLKEADDDYN